MGWFWDPHSDEPTILYKINGDFARQANPDGGWTSYYKDDEDRLYTLTCVGDIDGEPVDDAIIADRPEDPKDPKKVFYTPVQKEGIKDFVENAWPAAHSPSASGLTHPAASPGHSSGSDGSSEVPSPFGGKKAVVAADLRCALGSKPVGNPKPLDYKLLKCMTLKDHMAHVRYYSTAAQFKLQLPDEISENFWAELVEIFIGWHAYAIDDIEVMIWTLKRMYSDLPPVSNWILNYVKTCWTQNKNIRKCWNLPDKFCEASNSWRPSNLPWPIRDPRVRQGWLMLLKEKYTCFIDLYIYS